MDAQFKGECNRRRLATINLQHQGLLKVRIGGWLNGDPLDINRPLNSRHFRILVTDPQFLPHIVWNPNIRKLFMKQIKTFNTRKIPDW